MVFHCRCLSFSIFEEEQSPKFYTPSSDFDPSPANILRAFTFSELKAATNDFSQSAKIGEGGFGCVYMGVVKNAQDSTKTLDVAVKRLGQTRLKGHKEWERDINVGVIRHPNLVKLVGYCAIDYERKRERLLVYEHMSNRSVKDQLSRRSEAPLSWTVRLKVVQDVARGLVYVHEQLKITSGDLKSSNVLLDGQWNAKLSDFWLAGLSGPEREPLYLSAPLKQTDEYMSPEYIHTGHLAYKSDVWSYGVFLFELITGRRPWDWRQPENENKLLEWVKPYKRLKRIKRIIDPRLEGNYSTKSANKLASIAIKCLHKDPNSRPKMSEVLKLVDQLIIIVVPSSPSGPVSVVSIEPKMGEKTSENKKSEGETGSTKIQPKESACFSRMC